MSTMVVTSRWGELKIARFEEPLTVFLDSGAQYSYLPPHILEPLVNATGAAPDFYTDATGAVIYSESIYSVNCESEGWDLKFSGSVDFGFGNMTIRVPVQQLVKYLGGDDCVLL